MRIAIDGIPLITPKTGIGRYTFELQSALRRLPQAPSVRIHYGVHWAHKLRRQDRSVPKQPWTDTASPNEQFRWLPRQTKNWIKKRVAQTELRLYRPDIFHATNYVADSFGTPTVITVPDLSWIRYPETHPPERLAVLKGQLPGMLSAARRIIAISEFTKKEIIALLNVPEERITVVDCGVTGRYGPKDMDELTHRLKTVDLTPKQYILSVGTLEPRKNILSLVNAYERLPASLQSRWPLVIAGMRGWKDQAIVSGMEALTRRGAIRPLGYVDDDMLPFIYAGAALFIYPSLYEGFGLPALEAMASGVPVAVSKRSSLPEVVGKAGVYFNPEDAASISDVMMSLMEDLRKRERLGEKGLEQAKRFSWDRCAEETYAIYRQALDGLE